MAASLVLVSFAYPSDMFVQNTFISLASETWEFQAEKARPSTAPLPDKMTGRGGSDDDVNATSTSEGSDLPSPEGGERGSECHRVASVPCGEENVVISDDATASAEAGVPVFMSVGAKGHAAGKCKPCAFFHTKGCRKDEHCLFCHECDAAEIGRRKLAKRTRILSYRSRAGTDAVGDSKPRLRECTCFLL